MPSPPRIRSRRRTPAEDTPNVESPAEPVMPSAEPPLPEPDSLRVEAIPPRLEPGDLTKPLPPVEAEPPQLQPKGRRRKQKKEKKREKVVEPSERLKSLPAAKPVTMAPHRARNVKATKARQRAARRPAVVAGVIVISILCAVVAVTGLLVASEMRPRVTILAYPLQIYPVAQSTPGQCLPGTQGVTGPGPFCYQVTEGIAIHRVSEIQEQHDKSLGYVVFIKLRPGDKKIFADLTRRTLGRSLLFVVRDRLVTVSHVDTPILGGQILITGLSGQADADRVYRNLKGKV